MAQNAVKQNDNPGACSLSYEDEMEPVRICRDVYAGTLAMRDNGNAYLRQFPKESDAAYSDRKSDAVLFNGFRKTVKGLGGMVFRKDIQLGDDVPEQIVPLLENFDLAGRHFDVFVRDGFEDKTQAGHNWVLVDWSGTEGTKSKRQEETGGARPYAVLVQKEQVRRVRSVNRGGRTVLTRFAYHETETVPDGEFTERLIERVRQYDLNEAGQVTFQSWTRPVGEDKAEWAVEAESRPLGERMKRIPVVPDYAARAGVFKSDPPLLDLALENVRHFQVRSERDTTLHVASVPIFTITGVDPEQASTVIVSTEKGLVLPEGADAKYVEAAGGSLSEARTELQDIEQRMATMGLAMLQRQSRSAETAEAKRIDKDETDSHLAVMARGSQDAYEEVLGLFAMWMGLPSGGSIIVNRDFSTERLTPEMAKVLLAWVEAGKIRKETAWAVMVRGEILPGDFDPKLEAELLEAAEGLELERQRMELERMRAASMRQEDGDSEDVADEIAAAA